MRSITLSIFDGKMNKLEFAPGVAQKALPRDYVKMWLPCLNSSYFAQARLRGSGFADFDIIHGWVDSYAFRLILNK